MQLHQLKRKTKNKKAKLVGRGGGRGKTAGRGTKGQKARAGHRIRPEVRDVIKKLPKRRGYKNTSIVAPQTPVNVYTLEQFFAAGDTVSPAELVKRKVISVRKGATPHVKILGDGELSKKLTVVGCAVSASAKEKIEKAGGQVTTK